MHGDPPHLCEDMTAALDDLRLALTYDDHLREYRIHRFEGPVFAAIQFCPFCGGRLPQDLRDRWFDELEELGVDPGSDPIPVRYQTGAWWRERDDLGE